MGSSLNNNYDETQPPNLNSILFIVKLDRYFESVE